MDRVTFMVQAGEAHPALPLDAGRLWSAWTWDPVTVIILVTVAALYLCGVLVLRRRGDRWSVWRTVSFCVVGLGALTVATCSSLATYDTTLISVHMVQHLLLSMVAPVFLALGAPVSLALRCLPAFPRRWLLAALHSKVTAVVASPPVAFVLFIASPWALYLSGWYEATLRSVALHDLLHLHFVVVGCLFFWPLLGLDPVPGRVAYPFRMLIVFATLPFHAFLGVTMMTMNTVIARDWYVALGRHRSPTPLQDQHVAGGILWGSGDLVALMVFGALFAQWVRQSMREAAREDRRLDREERLAQPSR